VEARALADRRRLQGRGVVGYAATALATTPRADQAGGVEPEDAAPPGRRGGHYPGEDGNTRPPHRHGPHSPRPPEEAERRTRAIMSASAKPFRRASGWSAAPSPAACRATARGSRAP